MEWIKIFSQLTKGEIIAVDGKTLRRSHDNSNGKSAIHMVSAWPCSNGLVIGRIKTEEKSNAITSIPRLLKLLEIEGCIVTIDAMGCQKYIAETITEKNADYVFSLKGNQSNLHDDVKLFFQSHKENNFKTISFDYHETLPLTETTVKLRYRKYWTTSDMSRLQGKENWKNLETICMVEGERQFDNKTVSETSYYMCSMENNAEHFAHAVRSHCGPSKIGFIGCWMYHSVKMGAE